MRTVGGRVVSAGCSLLLVLVVFVSACSKQQDSAPVYQGTTSQTSSNTNDNDKKDEKKQWVEYLVMFISTIQRW